MSLPPLTRPGSQPPTTQADADRAAIINQGKRLTLIEERLGHIESILLDLSAEFRLIAGRLGAAE